MAPVFNKGIKEKREREKMLVYKQNWDGKMIGINENNLIKIEWKF